MQSKKDHCTSFPEHWIRYRASIKPWKWFEVVYIGNICKKHDERCGTHGFYSDLWNERIVGAVIIATIATLACWWKHPKLMKDKI